MKQITSDIKTKPKKLVFDQIIINKKIYYVHPNRTVWDSDANIVGGMTDNNICKFFDEINQGNLNLNQI